MEEQIEFEKKCNEDKTSLYNKIIKLDSMNQLLNGGWKIIRSKNQTIEDVEKPVAIVAILGDKNSGKSFILHLLTKKQIPNGYSVTTEGLSFVIPDNNKNKDDNYILIDTAGTESPLLIDDSNDSKIEKNKKINKTKFNEKEIKEENKEEINEELKQDFKEENNEEGKKTIENMLKDRQITDYFIQNFILEKSDIFICVVDNLTLTAQKFMNRIAKYILNKKIFIVHNLKTFVEKHQVEEYIQDTLLQSLTFDLEKEEYHDLTRKKKESEENSYFYKQKLKNENRIIIHLIMANQDSEAGKYYNNFAISYLNKQLTQVKEKRPFDIVKNLKEYVVSISGEIFKSKIDPNLIIEEDNAIKINARQLELKDCSIDVLGNNIIKDTVFKPRYRYGFFVDKEKKENKLFLEIELFAVWKISQRITTKDNHFIIHVEGKKKIQIVERKYIQNNYNPGNEFTLEIEVGNDKGFLGDDPTVIEENGLYTLIYTIRKQNRDEEIVSKESDEEADF